MAADLKARLAAAAAAGTEEDGALTPVFGGAPVAARVERLALDQLDPWSSDEYETQPFRLYGPKKMQEMMESLHKHGLHSPIIVRPRNGRYQILAGHNRVICAGKLGWTEIEALVKPGLTDQEAAELMVDTNFNQRDRILPSERAWGWKIKMDHLRHQGRQDASSHGGTKRSDAIVGEAEGKGRSTIQRYVALTRLIPSLLEIVDGYQYSKEAPEQWVLDPDHPAIPITAAENLTGLSQEDQEYIVGLFRNRLICGVTKTQSIELKAVRATTPPTKNIPPESIRRCLALGQAHSVQRAYVFKLATPPETAKYKNDEALRQLIVHTIERYVAEKEAGYASE